MNAIQKCSICCVLFIVARGDARTMQEHEINDEAIKTVLSDELKIKSTHSNQHEKGSKNTTFDFDFAKVNSSTERPMLNIDMIYDQIDALERYLAGVSAQVQALKAQVRETKQVAQEKHDAEQKQTQSLLVQLQEAREKLNHTQQLLAVADQRQQQLEVQVAQLAQVEKPVDSVVAAMVDGPEVQQEAPHVS